MRQNPSPSQTPACRAPHLISSTPRYSHLLRHPRRRPPAMESGLVTSHRLRLPSSAAAAHHPHLLRHRPLAAAASLRLPRHLPRPTPLRLPAALPLRPCLPPLRASASTAASPAPGDASAAAPKFLGTETRTLKKI